MLINSGLDVSPRENDPWAACLVGVLVVGSHAYVTVLFTLVTRGIS
jgi:hypothetical protein